ncbi:hypothetical protein RSSM_05075 [Rhodopirellula sallentina SM41]|uniref:Uncharacterized protein n=1 Tax=Rhodopirellula sallentina SM41 TaxID=1263870 RepID=M5TWP5_9BACT|nr:hypothetical protein RSSM_05075 [Rhodopirellula sallentina SM41]
MLETTGGVIDRRASVLSLLLLLGQMLHRTRQLGLCRFQRRA